MRTRTILPIALMAALINSPVVAQQYSSNVVGYINLMLPQGYSLLTAPLLEPNQTNSAIANAVSDIFENFFAAAHQTNGPLNGFTVFTMDSSGFTANNYLNGWTDPEMTLGPGSAWFFKNPYDFQDAFVTFVGAVPDGTNQLPAGFSACGSIAPFGPVSISIMMFPAANGDQVFTFNNTNNTYSVYTFTNNNWLPDEPSVGDQGFWVNKNAGADWVEDLGLSPSLFAAQPQLSSQVGQLNFFTFNAADAGFGQVMDTNGDLLATNGLGQLYAGTNANPSGFAAVGTPVIFSANAPGYIGSGVVSVPFAAGGQTVYVQLRAWLAADGPTYETAYARGAPVGTSSVMTLTAHATIEGNQPGIPPPDVNGFASFALAVPSIPPLQILSPYLSANQLIFSFASSTNQSYVVWSCTDLTQMNWVQWASYMGTGSPIQISVPVTNGPPQQFFRVEALNSPG